MNDELLPDVGKAGEQVRINVAEEQHRLEEKNASRPDRGGAAKVGQKHLADHRLANKKEERADEERSSKNRNSELLNQLLMEACDQNGLAEDMTIHRIEHRVPRIGSLLRRSLRYINFRIEGIQLECVVVIRSRRSAGAHVAVATKTDLTAAIRQFAL